MKKLKYNGQSKILINLVSAVNELIDNSGGGGGGSGTISHTNLWNYTDDNSGNILYGTFTVTLSDDITNYDTIVIELVSYSGDLGSSSWNGTAQCIIDVHALEHAYTPHRFNYCSYSTRSSNFTLQGTTLTKNIDNAGNANGLVNVWGIKY